MRQVVIEREIEAIVREITDEEETEPYGSFMFSKRMATNATGLVNKKRLKGIDVSLHYHIDILLLNPSGPSDLPTTRTRRSTAMVESANSIFGWRWRK